MFANFNKEGLMVLENVNCTPESLIAISTILAKHENKSVLLFDRESNQNVCSLAFEGTIQKNEIYATEGGFEIMWCPKDEVPTTIPSGRDWIITIYDD